MILSRITRWLLHIITFIIITYYYILLLRCSYMIITHYYKHNVHIITK